jgi:hypothetical protein
MQERLAQTQHGEASAGPEDLIARRFCRSAADLAAEGDHFTEESGDLELIQLSGSERQNQLHKASDAT